MEPFNPSAQDNIAAAISCCDEIDYAKKNFLYFMP